MFGNAAYQLPRREVIPTPDEQRIRRTTFQVSRDPTYLKVGAWGQDRRRVTSQSLAQAKDGFGSTKVSEGVENPRAERNGTGRQEPLEGPNLLFDRLSVRMRRDRLEDRSRGHGRYDGHQHQHREQSGRNYSQIESDIYHDELHQPSRVH